MANEKLFTINLRKEFLKKPIYRRTKKAVTTVREFIVRHLKTKEVKIGPNLNLKLWERGKRHPPSKIKVKAILEEGIAYVELPEFEFTKAKPKEEKEDKKKSKVDVQEEKKKEQEKELNKELAHEEELKQKKEHHHEPIEVPHAEIKQPEKDIENKFKKGRVVGSTGKKSAKEAKP